MTKRTVREFLATNSINSRSEFAKKNVNLYQFALRNGFLDEFLGYVRRKHTKESALLLLRSMKVKNKAELRKKDEYLYRFLRKNKMLGVFTDEKSNEVARNN